MHRRLSVSSGCDLDSGSAKDTVALRQSSNRTLRVPVHVRRSLSSSPLDDACSGTVQYGHTYGDQTKLLSVNPRKIINVIMPQYVLRRRRRGAANTGSSCGPLLIILACTCLSCFFLQTLMDIHHGEECIFNQQSQSQPNTNIKTNARTSFPSQSVSLERWERRPASTCRH
jgi:hypothetical protein